MVLSSLPFCHTMPLLPNFTGEKLRGTLSWQEKSIKTVEGQDVIETRNQEKRPDKFRKWSVFLSLSLSCRENDRNTRRQRKVTKPCLLNCCPGSHSQGTSKFLVLNSLFTVSLLRDKMWKNKWEEGQWLSLIQVHPSPGCDVTETKQDVTETAFSARVFQSMCHFLTRERERERERI